MLKILYVAHIKEPLGHLTLALMEIEDEIFLSSKQVLLIIQPGCPASTRFFTLALITSELFSVQCRNLQISLYSGIKPEYTQVACTVTWNIEDTLSQKQRREFNMDFSNPWESDLTTRLPCKHGKKHYCELFLSLSWFKKKVPSQ